MDIKRHNVIDGKNKREIVLLKSKPCSWGKCSFCDYILDNSTNEDEIVQKNREVLSKVTGKHKVLEVINSGSCFELPMETLKDIKQVVESKDIKKIFLETHWMYRERLHEMRQFFNVPIIFKCGIETFDDEFRNKILKKGVIFSDPEEVAKYFDSVCLMVGIKGQTKDMIRRDIEILGDYFKYGCVNIYINNSTPIKRDEHLIRWFMKEYAYLEENAHIEVLWNNTDFGVGGEI